MRLGLMIPSSNTVMECDFARELSGYASVHVARMYLPDPITVEGEQRLLDEYALHAARDLGTLQPDLVVFGCTSAAAIHGKENDVVFRKKLASLIAAPVVGVVESLATSLRRQQFCRLVLLTPYDDELTTIVEDALTADGFDVLQARGLGLQLNVEIGRVEPSEIIDFADAMALKPECDVIVIACTNFRAMEAAEEIEEHTRRTVVTANSAVIEQVREKLQALARPEEPARPGQRML